MSKKPRDNRPYIPPVTKIEVSEGNLKLRWILLAIVVAIAAVSLGMGVHYALSTEPGWQEVQSAATELNCGDDFVFHYECGTAGISATAEYKAVTALYSRLTQDAYAVFTADTQSELHNVHYLNACVNQPVTVEPALYKALEVLDAYTCRVPFMAPAIREYNGVFLAENDGEAALYDPARDTERREYLKEILTFVNDPAMASLELLGENRVCLKVGETYLAYAEENGIETFFDFGWMKNAFIADYLAENLEEAGYTNGYLVSYDGFTRNLDARGTLYTANLFDRMENTISMPAQLAYDRPMSLVSLRNYPLSEEDRWHYYAYGDGSVTSVYLNLSTAMPVSSTDNLFSYSETMGCGEILMHTAPVFLNDMLEESQLLELENKGIHSIWAEGDTLLYTQSDAALTLLPESGGNDYRLQYSK